MYELFWSISDIIYLSLQVGRGQDWRYKFGSHRHRDGIKSYEFRCDGLGSWGERKVRESYGILVLEFMKREGGRKETAKMTTKVGENQDTAGLLKPPVKVFYK